MIINKHDSVYAMIPASFVTSTGAADTPDTSISVRVYNSSSASAPTKVLDTTSMVNLDSLTGAYFYRLDCTSLAVGSYIVYLVAVDAATSYPSTMDLTIIDLVEIPAATVADAVWDETIAGHLTSGTTGKTINDINTNIGIGNGSYAYSLHFENQNGTAKAGLQVWLTTDSAGSVLFTSKNNRTNSGGNITFYVALNVPYYVWTSESTTYATTFTKTS